MQGAFLMQQVKSFNKQVKFHLFFYFFYKEGNKMTKIYLVASDQTLTAAQQPKIAAGNKKSVTLHVDFSSNWDGYGKSAVFYTEKNKTPYECVLSDGECLVPVEVLANPGMVFIGVRGVNSDDNSVKVATLVRYRIVDGAPEGEGIPIEPTPDVYQQLLTAYGKADEAVATERAERQAEVAVERTRIDLLSNYVTPQMFGAVGDGVADDTNAIKTALSNGDKVYLPKGTYKVSSSIDIASGKSLILEGNVLSLSGITLVELKKQSLAIIQTECEDAFVLHNRSNLLGGVIHSNNTNVVVLDIGVENMQNVKLSTAILGDYVSESVGVLFRASTGTQGSICFSSFESAIHGFENAYKFDRPTGNYPWVTFVNVSGVLSGNKKAFTHNVSNYGLAFGSSTWNITLCGHPKWAGNVPLFDALGDNSTFNIKLSDIGADHSQKIGVDFLHAMKSTVNCVTRNDERLLNAKDHTIVFALDNINEITLANGTLYYTINGLCANCVYVGTIPKGGFVASDLPFSNVKTFNIPYCGNYSTRVRTESGWNKLTFINDTTTDVDVCLQFSTFII